MPVHAKFSCVAMTKTYLQILKILHFLEGILPNRCYDICRKIPEKGTVQLNAHTDI